MSLTRMLEFEYYIFFFASKAKPSFIFPSKAATQFFSCFSFKWHTLKSSSSFFNASARTQFTPKFVPQEEVIDQEKKKVSAVKY